MQPEPNMGRTDRTIRAIAGIWLLALAISASLDRRYRVSVAAGVAGVGLCLNSVLGFCSGNHLFGIDTRKKSCSCEEKF